MGHAGEEMLVIGGDKEAVVVTRDLLRVTALPPECWCWAPLDQVVVVVVVMGLKVPGGLEL